MEIERQVFPLFASFVRDVAKTYPETKNCLYRNYEECLVDTETKSLQECPKLQRFLDTIYEHKSKITRKEESFFEVEDILEEISFKNLWQKNITDKTKATIWKYFQTFSLLVINLKSSQELKDALSSIQNDEEEVHIDDKKVAKELKQMKRLTESVQQEIPEEEDGEFDLENMLGGMMDTNIGKIAKEVAGSMDMEKVFGNVDESTNPMELMSQMMNPEKMGQIFQNIHSVMETKMEKGDFKKDDLKKEAEGMYGNMAQNPMFQGMMDQMQGPAGATGEAATGTTEATGGATGGVTGGVTGGATEAELSKEEKRKILKEKIRAKESERTGGK